MHKGGAESRSVEMLRHVDPSKVHSIYCTTSTSPEPGALDEEIRALGGEVVPCPLGPGFNLRFRKLLREKKVTAMHGHVHYVSGLLCYYAWKEHVPVRIVHWHTTETEIRPFRKRMQDKVLTQLIERYATKIVAVGSAAMKSCWPKYEGDNRCKVLYTGLDKNRFDPTLNPLKTRAELGFPDDALLIAQVGRFHPVKNQLFGIQVFEQVLKKEPKARMMFIGKDEGEYEDQVKQKAKALGFADKVLFVGLVPDVATYLPASDLILLPSLFEGLPGVALESLASGIPVLASDIVTTREIRDSLPGCVLISLEETPEKWAETAIDLAHGFRAIEKRKELRDALFASHFNLEECVAGHIGVWQGRNLEKLGASI
jgi:glycosyltransferase involved in cell wall biosynthesis